MYLFQVLVLLLQLFFGVRLQLPILSVLVFLSLLKEERLLLYIEVHRLLSAGHDDVRCSTT